MLKDDRVISSGDHWVPAGSEGIVRTVKPNGSVLVAWESIPGRRITTPKSMFHKQSSLKVADGSWKRNPNIMFKRRKHENTSRTQKD